MKASPWHGLLAVQFTIAADPEGGLVGQSIMLDQCKMKHICDLDGAVALHCILALELATECNHFHVLCWAACALAVCP